MSNLLKKEKGFTLIEIVLVLAIAGLLLVIVFLAVSGAQKSRRDSQRKNDVSRVAAQLENFASNNNGIYPTTAEFTATTGALNFAGTYLGKGTATSTFKDPLTGADYNLLTTAPPATCTTALAGDMYYSIAQRTYTVTMCLEQGVTNRTNL